MSAVVAYEKLKGAWKEYMVAKKVVCELWKNLQEELMARKAINSQVSLEHLQKMMIWEERV